MSVSALDERPAGSPDDASPGATRAAPRLSDPVLFTLIAAAGMAVALVLARNTGLWLDEAQGLAIAQLPLGELFGGLRKDGAPPLYYLLLHAWTRLFGDGDTVVRSMSSVLAVAAVPMTMAAAREAVGRRAARLTGVVLVTLPFFYRYGTETRMYALVLLLVALLWWLSMRERHVLTAVVAGLLLLTHYWAFFLIAGGVLVAASLKRWRNAVALVAGGLLFLPWLPTFVYQTLHTGAPWGRRPQLDAFDIALSAFAGGQRVNALALVYFAAAVLAVRHSEFGRRIALGTAVPLAVAILVSYATNSAFAERYTAIVVVPFTVLVAAGLMHVGSRKATRIFLAAMLVLGVFYSVRATVLQRSQAPQIAAALIEHAQPGERIIFCPDQLGPAVVRLLPAGMNTQGYPLRDKADIVNWVDYAERNRAADPYAFARQLHEEDPGPIWIAFYQGYRTFGRDCTTLVEQIRELRPGDTRHVRMKRSSYERATLWRFPGRE